MKPLIKICGINDFNILQQLASIDSIDYLGFIFYEKSVRNVSPEFLEQIKKRTPIWKKEHYGNKKSLWLKGISLKK